MTWLLLTHLAFADSWTGVQDADPDDETAEDTPEDAPQDDGPDQGDDIGPTDDDPEEDPEQEQEQEPEAPVLTPEEIAQAQQAPEVTTGQLNWLKPRLKALPPNPYAHTDFTAYTLDWGEVKLGLNNVQVGFLPRTQVGTSVPLDVIGVYNGNVKVNPLRRGPVALSLEGAFYRYTQTDFLAQYWNAGGTLSFVVTPKVGIHVGAAYWSIELDGKAEAGQLHPMLSLADQIGAIPEVNYLGDATSVDLAVDFRLNRRDSLILQASSVVWMADRSPDQAWLPPTVAQYAAMTDGEWSPLNTYRASVAYQMDLKRLSLRAGVGISRPRAAWALTTFEVAYRFGGKTKRDERHQRATWRENRRDARRGTQE
jgi:hypothetical protein